MNESTNVDTWCDVVEAALADGSQETWGCAAAVPLSRLALPADADEALRQAERLAALIGRVEASRLATRDELEAVTDERRQLVTHRRAVDGYRSTEAAEPIERLMRMMWVG